jgi:hypothetical protein
MTAKRLILSLGILMFWVSAMAAGWPSTEVKAATNPVECRFGITVPAWPNGDWPNKTVASYDLTTVGVGYYLDWTSSRSPTVPQSISFVHVLQIGNGSFAGVKANLKTKVENNLGAVWIVGNEPDNNRNNEQDDVTAEVYAARFFDLATIIRATDPSAKITFGTIIMSTKLRIRYIQRAWDELKRLTGSEANASALVDIWTPHGFILNEEAPTAANPGPWGSGIPLGFENDHADQEIVDITEIGNLDKFITRMKRFRQFMKDNGEQNKPLWLTEYGILAASQDPPNSTVQYYLYPESVTAKFFSDTVNWMESYIDPNLGMPGDGNRLIQKWFWYSLNDAMYHFGGTVIDPLTLSATVVGATYINYEPPAGTEPYLLPDVEPIAIRAFPVERNVLNPNLVDYLFTIRIRNNVVHNHLTNATINFYDENNLLLGTASVNTNRCGGDGIKVFNRIALSPTLHNFKVVVSLSPASGPDANPGNDQKVFPLLLGLPYKYFAPVVR